MSKFTNGLFAATFLILAGQAYASSFSLESLDDSSRARLHRKAQHPVAKERVEPRREPKRKETTHKRDRHPATPPQSISQPQLPAPPPPAPVLPTPVLPRVAGPTLILSDGAGHTTRLSNASGVISFTGTLGSFSLSIKTSAATGEALLPSLTLNSLSYSGAAPGTLTISLSNTSLNAPLGNVTSEIKGQTNNGSLSYSTYADLGNSLFGKGTLLGSEGAYTGGSFAGAASAALSSRSPFSLTETIVLQESYRGTTTFGATVIDPPAALPVPVPETGSTLALLGLALAAIEAVRRGLRAG